MSTPLLSVQNLDVAFQIEGSEVPIIRDLSFEVSYNEVLGIVGESGCGKSMTALALMGLVPNPPGRITNGSILFEGRDLAKVSEPQMQSIRGNEISMVFQEPMTSLNPVYTVGEQIAETARAHFNIGRAEAKDRAVEMLKLVGIPSPERRFDDYPHQMSGGMRQRVMIAISLICEPKLLIADEPTTALDVTVQAQIFDLFKELQEKIKTSIILITHDIGVVAEMTDRVMVMYAGRKIEEGPVADFIQNPRHPYTKGLISCIPTLQENPPEIPVPLFEIPGVVPSASELSRPGCAFAPRCSQKMDRCANLFPQTVELATGRIVSCWLEMEENA